MPVRIVSPEKIQACLRIRLLVFVEEQKVPHDLEVDGLDPDCTHFLATDPDGNEVGTARMRVTEDGQVKAERVAVLLSARGTGVGADLMAALEIEAQTRGFSQVILSAQMSALPFYERRGYVANGPVFDDAGIPHRKMHLDFKS